jgi:transcriptional regulator with XRE-family HTH domain
MPEFNDIDLSQVAQRVSAARARLGLSQTTLAKAAGVSQPTVSRIESGTRGVSLMDADLLASALGLPLDLLLYGSRVADRVLVSLRVDEDTNAGQAIEAGVELLELDERLD